MRREPKRPLIAGLLVLAVLATASVAHAAVLPISTASLSTFDATNPCDGTAQATPFDPVGGSGRYRQVQLVLPTGCSGTLQAAVLDGASPLTTVTVPAASGTVTIDVGQQYYPDDITVVATLAGWHLETVWSHTPVDPPPPPPTGPVTPGNAQTVITAIDWTIVNNNQACVDVTVTTNTPQNSWWQVDLNIDQAPFYGATSGYQITGGTVRFIPASGTAVDGVLGVEGSNNGWGLLSQGSTRTFTVCHYGLPSPPDDPSAYSVTYSQGTWTDTQACVLATITGNGSSEFYFGWSAQIDMTPAFERIESSGREVRRLQQDTWGNIVQYSPAFSPSVSTYDLTHLWQGVLRLSESRTVGICAYEN